MRLLQIAIAFLFLAISMPAMAQIVFLQSGHVLGNPTSSFGQAQDMAQSPVVNYQTANYAIAPTDCGKLIAMGGGGYFTLTIPSVSGFTAPCSIAISNTDLGRGKLISGVTLPISAGGAIPNVLFPTQSMTISLVSGSWAITQTPLRWKQQNSQFLTIYTDFNNGSDTLNDGLAAGSGNALRSVSQCFRLIIAVIDSSGDLDAITCQMAANTTDSIPVHIAPGVMYPGSFGNQNLVLNGASGSVLSGGLQAFYGAILGIGNLTMTNSTGGGTSAGDCIYAQFNATITIRSGFSIGPCANAAFDLLDNGRVQLTSTINWLGNMPIFLSAQWGGTFHANAHVINVPSNVTVTDTVACSFGAMCDFNNASWTLGGIVTATNSYICTFNSVLLGVASIPGTGGPISGTGCQTNP